ncbi:hypothetical protein IAU59_005229 [Kwoniella sp. CBS 9459]
MAMQEQERAIHTSFADELDWSSMFSQASLFTTRISPTPSVHDFSSWSGHTSAGGSRVTEASESSREEAELAEAMRRSMEDLTRGDKSMATRLQAEEITACLTSAAPGVATAVDSLVARSLSSKTSPQGPTIRNLVATLPVLDVSTSPRTADPDNPVHTDSFDAISVSAPDRAAKDDDDVQTVLDRLTADLAISQAEKEGMARRLRSHDGSSAPLTLWRSEDGMERGVVRDFADGKGKWKTWRDV